MSKSWLSGEPQQRMKAAQRPGLPESTTYRSRWCSVGNLGTEEPPTRTRFTATYGTVRCARQSQIPALGALVAILGYGSPYPEPSRYIPGCAPNPPQLARVPFQSPAAASSPRRTNLPHNRRDSVPRIHRPTSADRLPEILPMSHHLPAQPESAAA